MHRTGHLSAWTLKYKRGLGRVLNGVKNLNLNGLMFGCVLTLVYVLQANASSLNDGLAVERLSTEARLEIDRVEITGVTVFDQPSIEGALEIGVGDRLERIKVIRTVENFQSLYRIRGYENTEVRSEFLRTRSEAGSFENILRIQIIEGKPVRIASIHLVPALARSDDFQKSWKSIEPMLFSLLGVTAGNILDQDRIIKGKRSVLDYLATEEYVGAKIDDVRLSTAVVPSGTKLEASRWLDLEFRVDLGDQVTFGFRGNTALTRGYLNALVEEQRLLGFGKDYVGSIQNRIEDEYRSMGYAQVRVTPYTFEKSGLQERHISYAIQEGFRVLIDAVDFDGNVIFSGEQLKKRFFSLSAPLVQRGYFINKEIEKAAERLIERLKSEGYLSAKLVTISRIPLPPKNGGHESMRLVIYLYEGEQTQVQKIQILGIKAFSYQEIIQLLGIQKDYPLNLFTFSEGLEALKATYRSKGYLSMSILNEGKENVVQYSEENRKADIHLEIEEGSQYRAGRIQIDGLTKTINQVVEREFQFQAGDVIDEHKLMDTEARLRRLGIFSAVKIRAAEDEEGRPGYKTVQVLLEEGTPGVIAGGVGYRNDLGIRVFGQTTYTNLWSRNHALSFGVNLNRRFDDVFCANIDRDGIAHGGPCYLEYRFELGYHWPWFTLGETSFRPRITVERTQFRSFDAETKSLAAGLERRLLANVNLTGAFTYSLEQVEQKNPIIEIDRQTLLIGAVTPALRLDLRDNSLAPTSGLYSTVSYEFAHPSFLGQSNHPSVTQDDRFPIAYSRVQWRTDGFIPLGREMTWYLSARFGFEQNLVATPPEISPQDLEARRFAIPLIKQFALGGAGSVRGFGEQKINKADLAIRGTLSYANYRTQLDFPFAGSLRFGPFFDAARLAEDNCKVDCDFFKAAGVGFHYMSPVGPVNFDWGFNLKPREQDDPYQFHFSIGVI